MVNQNKTATVAGLAMLLAKIKIKDYATPERYGAKGDRTTDDTSAIQQAIDSSDVVVFYNHYKIKNTLTLPTNKHLIFLGGELYCPSSFSGSTIINVTGSTTNLDKSGSIVGATIHADHIDVIGVTLTGVKHFDVSKFTCKGCHGGGIVVNSGYEFYLSDFNITYDYFASSESQESAMTKGIEVKASDSEISNGAIVCYPVGCVVTSNTRVINVHAWGLDATNSANVRGFTRYCFVATDKQNTFVGCCGDTPTVVDTSADPSDTNGGIAFWDANTNYASGAFPNNNSYVGCSVISTKPAKTIGFHLGDAGNQSSRGTSIISPVYPTSELYAKLLIANNAIKPFVTHLTPDGSVGGLSELYCDTVVNKRSDYDNQQYNTTVTKTKQLRLLTSEAFKFSDSVDWITVNSLSIATNIMNVTSAAPAYYTPVDKKYTFTSALVNGNQYKIGTITTWHGDADVYVVKTADGFYLKQDGAGVANIWLEINYTYGTNNQT